MFKASSSKFGAISTSKKILLISLAVSESIVLLHIKTPPKAETGSDFNAFFHEMLSQGIYFGPSAFEAGFVSAQHSDEDINFTINCAKKAFQKI